MLVLEMGLAPDYVLDRMEMYEARALIKNSHYRKRESWEQTRLLGYLQAQANSSKRLKPSDIISFPWDDSGEQREVSPRVMSDTDAARLRAKAAYLLENRLI